MRGNEVANGVGEAKYISCKCTVSQTRGTESNYFRSEPDGGKNLARRHRARFVNKATGNPSAFNFFTLYRYSYAPRVKPSPLSLVLVFQRFKCPIRRLACLRTSERSWINLHPVFNGGPTCRKFDQILYAAL